MIKGVLFDWNGTVLDDVDAILKAANSELLHLGGKEIGLLRFRQTFQVPIDRYLQRNGIDRNLYLENVEEIQSMFMGKYREYSKKSKLRKNIRKLFQWLQKRDIQIGILSAHREEDIQSTLKKLKLDHYIDSVVAHNTDITGMHKSKDVPKACRQLNVRKENLLIVGDTGHDISVGKEFNVPVAAVTGGYYTKKRLQELKPDYLVDDVWEVKGIIEKYNLQNNGE